MHGCGFRFLCPTRPQTPRRSHQTAGGSSDSGTGVAAVRHKLLTKHHYKRVIPSEGEGPWCLPTPSTVAQAQTKIPHVARDNKIRLGCSLRWGWTAMFE